MAGILEIAAMTDSQSSNQITDTQIDQLLYTLETVPGFSRRKCVLEWVRRLGLAPRPTVETREPCAHPLGALFHHGFVSGKLHDYRCNLCNTVVNIPGLDCRIWATARIDFQNATAQKASASQTNTASEPQPSPDRALEEVTRPYTADNGHSKGVAADSTGQALCQCGHWKQSHYIGSTEIAGPCGICSCMSFALNGTAQP
jgi:hypothetical protein